MLYKIYFRRNWIAVELQEKPCSLCFDKFDFWKFTAFLLFMWSMYGQVVKIKFHCLTRASTNKSILSVNASTKIEKPTKENFDRILLKMCMKLCLYIANHNQCSNDDKVAWCVT